MRGVYWKHMFLDRPNSPGLPLLDAERALLKNSCDKRAALGVSSHSSALCFQALCKTEQGQGPPSIASIGEGREVHRERFVRSTACQGSRILNTSTSLKEKKKKQKNFKEI